MISLETYLKKQLETFGENQMHPNAIKIKLMMTVWSQLNQQRCDECNGIGHKTSSCGLFKRIKH